jgi:uncharacterized protein
MTVVVLPTGYCNIKCSYCFESEEMRSTAGRPNLAAVERTLDFLLERLPSEMPVGLHGGECTMVPLKDLEALLAMITKRRGHSAVQTNGYQMSPALIDLFKTYNTKVSISWDGPGELNRFRGPDPSDRAATLAYTEQLARNVERLGEAGVRVSITSVLSRANASDDEKLDQLKRWMLWLHERGVVAGRFNPLFRHPPDPEMELTGDELAYAYTTLFDFVTEHQLTWFPFREMIDNLLGLSLGPCVFAGCNPENTFVYSVFPNGHIGNCDRTMGSGMVPRPEFPRRNVRLEVLKQNHCAGCRYWRVCHGGCPAHSVGEGTAITPRFCKADYALYSHIESRLRGLLPNIRLVVDGKRRADPFALISANPNPSSFRPPAAAQGDSEPQPSAQSPVPASAPRAAPPAPEAAPTPGRRRLPLIHEQDVS